MDDKINLNLDDANKQELSQTINRNIGNVHVDEKRSYSEETVLKERKIKSFYNDKGKKVREVIEYNDGFIATLERRLKEDGSWKCVVTLTDGTNLESVRKIGCWDNLKSDYIKRR